MVRKCKTIDWLEITHIQQQTILDSNAKNEFEGLDIYLYTI